MNKATVVGVIVGTVLIAGLLWAINVIGTGQEHARELQAQLDHLATVTRATKDHVDVLKDEQRKDRALAVHLAEVLRFHFESDDQTLLFILSLQKVNSDWIDDLLQDKYTAPEIRDRKLDLSVKYVAIHMDYTLARHKAFDHWVEYVERLDARESDDQR